VGEPERRRWIGPDRFGVLLALVLVSFISTPVFAERELGGLVIGLQTGAIVLVAFAASGLSRRWVLIGGVVVAVAVVVVGSEAVFTDGAAASWASAIVTAMLACTPYLVLRRVLRHDRVTLSSVAGSLCAYLLIGLTFGSLYRTVSVIDAEAFSEVLGESANYVSFVTLTTLGFGDIVPTSDLARSLVTLEAVLGQVVLVTLVARSVSTLGQTKTPR
jgi:Ion channel